VSRMYKIFCEKCGHNNYSASKTGKLVCCYCGETLNSNSEKNKKDNKNIEKLA